jgi:phage terminase small subunit
MQAGSYRPILRLERQTAEAMARVLSELGFTPVSRAWLVTAAPQADAELEGGFETRYPDRRVA